MSTPEHNTSDERAAWSSRSLGSRFQHQCFYILIRLGGRRAAGVLLRVVVFWYVLFYRSVRRNADHYLRRRFPQHRGLRRWFDCYRLCLTFGRILVDRAAAGILGPGEFDIRFDRKQDLLDLVAQDRGLIIILAHAGCWQVALSGMDFKQTTVNMLMRQEDGDVEIGRAHV